MTKNIIPYSRQKIDQEDIKSVIKVLKSNFLTQGLEVPKFEEELANFCNVKYASVLNSATSALHVACLALGLNKNDILWTSPISFVASANCALYCGAKVDFIDIDNKTNNISIKKLEQKLIKAKKNKILPKIVIPVHMAGLSCDMKKIKSLSNKYGFKIIEDASHAIGAKYYDHKVGSCKYSHITVFSFHPVKIITSGEGGAALTNSNKIYKKMNSLRTHGIVKNVKRTKEQWRYDQVSLGYNYRLSDLHAGLGRSQLKKVNKFVRERNLIAQKYNQLFVGLPLDLPVNTKHYKSSFHLYIIKIQNKSERVRQIIYDKLQKSGYHVQVHYIPIFYHKYYRKMGFNIKNFPNTEKFYKSAISIPIYPGINLRHIKEVVKIIKSEL